MPELKILNSKEIKEILKLIEKQWGAKPKLDYGFLENNKGRIFVVSKDISKIDISKLRLNSVGMYFCEIDNKGIRLSIEGSQIIGKECSKNVLDVDRRQALEWMTGQDISISNPGKGYVIIRHEGDYLGCGKYVDGKILNHVPKERRLRVSISALP